MLRLVHHLLNAFKNSKSKCYLGYTIITDKLFVKDSCTSIFLDTFIILKLESQWSLHATQVERWYGINGYDNENEGNCFTVL